MSDERKLAVHAAVREGLGGGPVVLAVSGGRDSMVLLDAAMQAARQSVVAVATFDHATGPAAAKAAQLVTRIARGEGIPVVRGRARGAPRTEAALREERWRFLTSVGRSFRAPVATAHTQSDQVETVVMRILRGAGARGLGGLRTPAPGVLRPLLGLARAELASYADARALEFVHDPSNASRAWLRNRVRHDLLPALERAHPGFAREMLALGERAASWRSELERVLAVLDVRVVPGAAHVAADALADYDSASLAIVWPAIAARVGIVLDRRGTMRAAEFTAASRTGDEMPLSGGHRIVRGRDVFIVERAPEAAPAESVALGFEVRVGRWRLRRASRPAATASDAWSAVLPRGPMLSVRPWRPGDRMRPRAEAAPRRVKRFLREAGVPGPEREGWPVVLAGDEIVWIPGIRRIEAADESEGTRYVCERVDG